MTAAVLALPRRSTEAARAKEASEGVDLVLEHIRPGEVLFSTHRDAAGSEIDVCTTMLDFALAAAVQSALTPGRSYRPIDFAVSTMQPSQPLHGRVEATAQVVRSGGGLVVATGQVRGAAGLRATGRLVAVGPAR